jgi:hypothetical protein
LEDVLSVWRHATCHEDDVLYTANAQALHDPGYDDTGERMADHHDGIVVGPKAFEYLIGDAVHADFVGQRCQVAGNSAPSRQIHRESVDFRQQLSNALDGGIPTPSGVHPAVNERERGGYRVGQFC